MTKLTTLVFVTLASLGLAGGCKKDKPADPPPDPTMGSNTMGSAAGTMGSAAGSAAMGSAAATTDDTADKLVVTVDHVDKTKGPVDIVFSGVKVVKADFDPAKIEGGSADLEVDLGTLSSGVTKRDDHLRSDEYIDTGKFPKLTVHVDNVKKTGDKTFTGDATVKLRDVEKKFPVTFEVVDQQVDSIRIKGETKFSRLDFKVGKAPDKGDTAETDVTAKLHVTLKKT